MKTKVYDLLNSAEYDSGIHEGSAAIRRGGIVVFPTETVYGLGADAYNAQAAAKIFAAKGRPADNPLIVHIARPEDIFLAAESVPGDAEKLIEAFMPGPISIILPKNRRIPDEVTAGLPTVAVRCPSRTEASDFIAACGVPIAAPSANISHKPSPTMPEHVLTDMMDKADVILTAGRCSVGLESTVVDVLSGKACILRPGAISAEMISDVIGRNVENSYELKGGEVPKAPGMKYPHYKPKAHVVAVHGDPAKAAGYIRMRLSGTAEEGYSNPACAVFKGQDVECSNKWLYNAPSDADEAANRLFEYLRACDTKDIDIIFVMCEDGAGLWEAYANRLHKAADEMIYL